MYDDGNKEILLVFDVCDGSVAGFKIICEEVQLDEDGLELIGQLLKIQAGIFDAQCSLNEKAFSVRVTNDKLGAEVERAEGFWEWSGIDFNLFLDDSPHFKFQCQKKHKTTLA